MQFKSNSCFRRWVTYLTIFALIFGIGCLTTPGLVSAKADSGSPAEEFVLNVNADGEVIHIHTYTIGEMQALTDSGVVYYSSVDQMPAPNVTITEGVSLRTLIDDANDNYDAGIEISSGTLDSIKLYATDGWVRSYDYDKLFDTDRYYFPRLVETWDAENQVPGEGADEDSMDVSPLLATYSYQERFLTDLDEGLMLGPDSSDSTTFRFCFGQTDPHEVNNYEYGRWVYRMDLIATHGTYEKSTSGSVVLTSPKSSQSYEPGSTVPIRGEAEDLDSLTVTITDPDEETVYTSDELDVSGGSFRTSFVLDDDAQIGEYTIRVSSTGLDSDYTSVFEVADTATGISLIVPTEDQSYKQGSRVTIRGEASELDSVRVKVTDPDEETIYTSSELNASSGSFITTFDLKDDATIGDYTIHIQSAELDNEYTSLFGVVKADGSISLTSPTPAQTYYPGNPVDIRGTVRNLPVVTIKVVDPTGKAVYSGSNLDTSSGNLSTNFTLAGDAVEGEYIITISGTGLESYSSTLLTVKAKPLISAASFTDINNHWAQSQINALVVKGILSGVTATEFQPDRMVTRAEFATMLLNALHITPQSNTAVAFTDVRPDAWYYAYVTTAVVQGLAEGCGDAFAPDTPITREQMAVMVVNALAKKQTLAMMDDAAIAAALQRFSDRSDISAWAQRQVAAAAQQGLVQGHDNVFAPQSCATRAEAATLIYNLVDLLDK